MKPSISKRDSLRMPESVEPTTSSEIPHAILSVLAELETSLEASLRSLLSHDLSGFERSSTDQLGLLQKLRIFWPGGAAPAPTKKATAYEPPLESELRAAQFRVLHLVRIQAAVLARAQRGLKMLDHLAAGTGAGYSPSFPVSPPFSTVHVLRQSSTEIMLPGKGSLCRD